MKRIPRFRDSFDCKNLDAQLILRHLELNFSHAKAAPQNFTDGKFAVCTGLANPEATVDIAHR
ncbi:hypothetical protein H6S82_19195 [Planktothrix sp. FACHB-1355]|uniref:Uncharacterized protein n=1 Tax=Aerosakkonema funiforme FACHB-1375 TaxID=2949571 RepID=A0A926VG33_9CYAN|nr:MULTISPECIES: hypothetical protein [Oscillatoriales]MBD2183280.1 hypothetical protein [Aerosakkonema funiforme FACHB-1375]MBD3560960.1 hypothetical protein [Planktothrix sp. FACHB-1355]